MGDSNIKHKFITPEELENGFEDLPKIPKNTQKNLRTRELISYQKIGGKVHYTYTDVMKYIESTRKEAKEIKGKK